MFISDEFKQIMEQKPASMQEIWEIEDEYEFVSELSMYIAEKCDYGSNLDVLSDEEKVFYITQTLEMEVNNGGFWQFLYNVEEDAFLTPYLLFRKLVLRKQRRFVKMLFLLLRRICRRIASHGYNFCPV